MGHNWKPGDVAIVDSWRGDGQLAFRCQRGEAKHWCVLDGADVRGLDDNEVSASRPVAVIDPDDTDAVERLVRLFWDHANDDCDDPAAMREALREFAAPTPPRPSVYSHIVMNRERPGEIAQSLCGKVWKPGADVDVVGECPNCRDLIGRWVA